MSGYLDPKADIVFKKIFGQHPHLLKRFLNGGLPLPESALIESYQEGIQAEKIRIAKQLLLSQIEEHTIAKITGLSLTDLTTLMQESSL